jgi:hypothetical protein
MAKTSAENITLDRDIPVFYVTADSYPEGIMAAHESLRKLVPFSKERNYFGLSRPENGGSIVYRAAAQELTAGEGKTLGCDNLVIKKGTYTCITVKDYLNHLQDIELAFRELLRHPQLDPQGYCVEWYFNAADVRCMVRLVS